MWSYRTGTSVVRLYDHRYKPWSHPESLEAHLCRAELTVSWFASSQLLQPVPDLSRQILWLSSLCCIEVFDPEPVPSRHLEWSDNSQHWRRRQ